MTLTQLPVHHHALGPIVHCIRSSTQRTRTHIVKAHFLAPGLHHQAIILQLHPSPTSHINSETGSSSTSGFILSSLLYSSHSLLFIHPSYHASFIFHTGYSSFIFHPGHSPSSYLFRPFILGGHSSSNIVYWRTTTTTSSPSPSLLSLFHSFGDPVVLCPQTPSSGRETPQHSRIICVTILFSLIYSLLPSLVHFSLHFDSMTLSVSSSLFILPSYSLHRLLSYFLPAGNLINLYMKSLQNSLCT